MIGAVETEKCQFCGNRTKHREQCDRLERANTVSEPATVRLIEAHGKRWGMSDPLHVNADREHQLPWDITVRDTYANGGERSKLDVKEREADLYIRLGRTDALLKWQQVPYIIVVNMSDDDETVQEAGIYLSRLVISGFRHVLEDELDGNFVYDDRGFWLYCGSPLEVWPDDEG